MDSNRSGGLRTAVVALWGIVIFVVTPLAISAMHLPVQAETVVYTSLTILALVAISGAFYTRILKVFTCLLACAAVVGMLLLFMHFFDANAVVVMICAIGTPASIVSALLMGFMEHGEKAKLARG